MATDLPWGTRKVQDLVHGAHLEEDLRGRHFLVEGFSWFEQKCLAYDTGVPEVALDAIQLDRTIEEIEDLAMKAAITLRLHGWDVLDIASILHDRRKRPTVTIIEDGLDKIRKIERLRKASGER